MGILDSLKNMFGGGNSDAAPAAPEMEATATPEAPAPTMEAPMADMSGGTDAAPAAPVTDAPVEETPVA